MIKKTLIFVVIAAAMYFASQEASAKEYVGIPTVIDGDTLDLHGDRIRLFGIDAFESRQSCKDSSGERYRCGKLATNFLDELVSRKTIHCKKKSTSYGRIVAVCKVGALDLASALVENGHALAWSKYSRRYLPEMKRAQSMRAGAWQGDFIKPWVFRNPKKKN